MALGGTHLAGPGPDRTMLHNNDLGLWRAVHRHGVQSGRGCLFLDRDGVIVEDTHYLSRVEDIRMVAGAAERIAAWNRQGMAVVIVTNQAGIGRGLYDWAAFAAVQDAILAQLAAAGALIDATYACGYHEEGHGALKSAGDHPWRKPNPGMLLAAQADLALDFGRSWIIGDRGTDLAAGHAAGLAGGTLVATGYGGEASQQGRALALAGPGFRVETAGSIATAQLTL